MFTCVKLNIYYKSRKVKHLFIRNNSNKPDQPFNVVYQYTCNQGECTTSQSTYIGHTRTTIKERFKSNTQRSRNITNKSTTATLQDYIYAGGTYVFVIPEFANWGSNFYVCRRRNAMDCQTIRARAHWQLCSTSCGRALWRIRAH